MLQMNPQDILLRCHYCRFWEEFEAVIKREIGWERGEKKGGRREQEEKRREIVSVEGEKRVRTNEMGAGKEYGERDWEKEKQDGRVKRRKEGVKRGWEGKETWRRERGEADEKRSRQLGWERGLNWKGGIRE